MNVRRLAPLLATDPAVLRAVDQVAGQLDPTTAARVAARDPDAIARVYNSLGRTPNSGRLPSYLDPVDQYGAGPGPGTRTRTGRVGADDPASGAMSLGPGDAADLDAFIGRISPEATPSVIAGEYIGVPGNMRMQVQNSGRHGRPVDVSPGGASDMMDIGWDPVSAGTPDAQLDDLFDLPEAPSTQTVSPGQYPRGADVYTSRPLSRRGSGVMDTSDFRGQLDAEGLVERIGPVSGENVFDAASPTEVFGDRMPRPGEFTEDAFNSTVPGNVDDVVGPGGDLILDADIGPGTATVIQPEVPRGAQPFPAEDVAAPDLPQPERGLIVVDQPAREPAAPAATPAAKPNPFSRGYVAAGLRRLGGLGGYLANTPLDAAALLGGGGALGYWLNSTDRTPAAVAGPEQSEPVVSAEEPVAVASLPEPSAPASMERLEGAPSITLDDADLGENPMSQVSELLSLADQFAPTEEATPAPVELGPPLTGPAIMEANRDLRERMALGILSPEEARVHPVFGRIPEQLRERTIEKSSALADRRELVKLAGMFGGTTRPGGWTAATNLAKGYAPLQTDEERAAFTQEYLLGAPRGTAAAFMKDRLRREEEAAARKETLEAQQKSDYMKGTFGTIAAGLGAAGTAAQGYYSARGALAAANAQLAQVQAAREEARQRHDEAVARGDREEAARHREHIERLNRADASIQLEREKLTAEAKPDFADAEIRQALIANGQTLRTEAQRYRTSPRDVARGRLMRKVPGMPPMLYEQILDETHGAAVPAI